MQEQPIRDPDEPAGYRDPVAEDTNAEAAVLDHLIELAPQQIREDELIRELAGPDAEFGERDKYERAIKGLLGYGLLNRSGELLIPSRSAIRYSELLDT